MTQAPESFSGDHFAERHLRYELVADEAALARELDAIRAARAEGRMVSIAVDLEYTENSDHDRRLLRLVQVGLGGPGNDVEPRQLLVDAQAVDAKPLQELFGDPALEKQVHAPGGDYEQWFRYVGLRGEHEVDRWAFCNVYDPAARVGALNTLDASLPEERRAQLERLVGGREEDGRLLPQKLASLTERLLGFRLSKRQRRSNWSRRELSPAQLRYAALDVAVAPFVVDRLRELERGLAGLGLDLGAAAEAEDLEHRRRSADLALVPVARRQELDALVARTIRAAGRRSGREALPDLPPHDRRYVAGKLRRARSRSELVEENGSLVVVTVPVRRQRELLARAEEAAAARGGALELRDELERRLVADFLRRKHPEVTLSEDGAVSAT